MKTITLSVLDRSGHQQLSWDNDSPAEVEGVRKMVDDLREKGYSFFLVDGRPADPVTAGAGALEVRRIADPLTEAYEAAPEGSGMKAPKRRGRPAKDAERAVVAIPQQRGG